MDAEASGAIGWALWRVRDDRGKSLRVVAELAGMSKDTLNRIERGLLSPTLNQLYALAKVLDVSAAELTRLPSLHQPGTPTAPRMGCGWPWTRSTSITPAAWCSPSPCCGTG